MASPSPIDFLDYRDYLAAYYQWKKQTSPAFSYRAFSRRAGIRSPNHLKRVIDGDRSLSVPIAEKFVKALALSDEEREVFFALVEFTQAETPSAREAAFRRLSVLRGMRDATVLDYRQSLYHEHWYIPAIRELAAIDGFRPDADWISRTLVPAVRADQAAMALDILFDLGFLVRDDAGVTRRADGTLTTGPQGRTEELRRYHAAMLKHAIRTIDELPPSRRDISAITFGGDASTMEKLKEKLASIRRELVTFATAAEADDPDRIYQVGLYAFPLSTPIDDDD